MQQSGSVIEIRWWAARVPEGGTPILTRLRAVAAPLIVVVAAVAWSFARGIDHRFLSFSDGVYLYLSSVVAEHGPHVLYGHVALSQPPGGVLGTAALWRLSPNVETVRAALAVCGLITALLAYEVGRKLFGLGRSSAGIAAVIALTGPIHAQFSGADPEVVLAPLALGLALLLERGRVTTSAALMGLGLFFKLTWAPFVLAGLVAVAARHGARAALRAGLSCGLVAGGLYAAGIAAFGWPVHALLAQVIAAESHSGYQFGIVPGIAAITILLWWPLLVLAPAGIAAASGPALRLIIAGALSAIFMLKQGTFLNELDPLEPFLALAAVAGATASWQRGRRQARAVVVVCALGLCAHTASLANNELARALPLPLGAAILNLDNEHSVDVAAEAIDAHSRPGDPVLVNPFLALVAHRHEPGDQADWFILQAIERSCVVDAMASCRTWSRIKALARERRLAVVGIDKNVIGFDGTFRLDTHVSGMQRVLRISEPPLETSLFTRSRVKSRVTGAR
jgi:hypothetical protein